MARQPFDHTPYRPVSRRRVLRRAGTTVAALATAGVAAGSEDTNGGRAGAAARLREQAAELDERADRLEARGKETAAARLRDQADDLRARATILDGGDLSFFDVSYVGTGSSTTAGDPFDVSATITNVGEEAGARTIALLFDDETVATMELLLDAGESTDVQFVLPGEQTVEFEPNRLYTVTVDSGDDAESTEKYVLPP